jgi:4'-phosphopantetheinyl transferase
VTGIARPTQATPGTTNVWIVDLAAEATGLLAVHEARSLLTEPELARAARTVDLRLRESWVAAHTALHLVLAEHVGRPISFAEANVTAKPRVADWQGDFSLTHSGKLALIAVRDHGQVGIDAEVRRPVRISAERRGLIEIAGAAVLPEIPLPEGDPDLRLLAAWTRLEAIGKLRATGIGALLEKLGIVARGPGADAVAERARGLVSDLAQPIALADIDVGHFGAVATLATSPPSSQPRLRNLSIEGGLLRG